MLAQPPPPLPPPHTHTHLHQLQSAARFYGRIAGGCTAAATAASVRDILGTNRAHGNLVELQIVVRMSGHKQQPAAGASGDANASAASRWMIRFAVANVDLNACGCGRRCRCRSRSGGRGCNCGGSRGRGHRIHLLLLRLLCSLHGEALLRMLSLSLSLCLSLSLSLSQLRPACSGATQVRRAARPFGILSHREGTAHKPKRLWRCEQGCIVGFNTLRFDAVRFGLAVGLDPGLGFDTCGVSRQRRCLPLRNEKGA